MRKKWLILLLFLILFFILFVQVAKAQYQLTSNVVGSGGTSVSNGSYNLYSTVGESFIGDALSATRQTYSGFWYIYKQSTISDIDDDETGIPNVFKLQQNYPNPFNPATIIKYQVPVVSMVSFIVYDIIGNQVAILVNEQKDPGYYEVRFSGARYASGVYLYRIQAGSFVDTKKMILLK